MSPGRLNIKTRLELETRVLAAALKISLQKGDLDGARLAHSELSQLIKPVASEDTGADEAQVARTFVDAQASSIPETVQPSVPPVQGELVRSPVGTPSGNLQPAAYQQPDKQPDQQHDQQQDHLPDQQQYNQEADNQLPAPEPVVSTDPTYLSSGQPIVQPLMQMDSAPILPIFPRPKASDMPDVDFSLQQAEESQPEVSGTESFSERVQGENSEPVAGEAELSNAPLATPVQSVSPDALETVPAPIAGPVKELVTAPIPAPVPPPLPAPGQPTASDALRRSIVNTPMRSSATNMPAIRTIDENVLKAASSSPPPDANQTKLSESLAKIEAAMNPGASAANGENVASLTAPLDAEADTSESETARDHQYQGLYRLLDVSQMSPYEEIHRNFLRKVRSYIRQINLTRRPEKLELLQNLRKIWIAHDILTDPVTRTDYDFRDLGLRGDVESFVAPAPEDKQQAQQTNRTPTRIGELLQCAGLLEPAELQIACDMHKAMPEVQFGTFLVKQGFIGERDLESVLLGQKLLRAGVISVAQFQVAMELSQSRGNTIGDTLVERGYVTKDGLDKAVETINAPATETTVHVPKVVDAVIPSEPEHGQGLAAALMPKITDLVDFEPMDQSTTSSGSNALTELLGGSTSSSSSPLSIFGAPAPSQAPPQFIQPAAEHSTEQSMPALNLSQAVPSWKDQLDWDSPDTVAEKIGEPARVESPVSETANLTNGDELSELPVQANPEPNDELIRAKIIDLGHAAPSWKDQLDWGSPEELSLEAIHQQAFTGKEVDAPASEDLSAQNQLADSSNAPAEPNPGENASQPPRDSSNAGTITSENAPLSITELGHNALGKNSEAENSRSSGEITGDYDKYIADENTSHTIHAREHNETSDTTNSTTGHSIASFFDSEKEEHQNKTDEPTSQAQTSTDSTSIKAEKDHLPGDDWVDIDANKQMETAAHLQPITMDNLTLKPGRSGKKGKDKKKHKH